MASADRGFPEEWRRHHQGGITGYRGREVVATPHDHTPSPNRVRWHSTRPSRAAGRSEDTALVGAIDGVELLTRTPDLLELELDGLPRPAVVEL
jgi:Xaa-Pro dipeptidase